MSDQEKIILIERQCLEWLNEKGYEVKVHEFRLRSGKADDTYDSMCKIELEFAKIKLTLHFEIDKVEDFHHIISDKICNQLYWHCYKIKTWKENGSARTLAQSTKSGHLPVLLKKYYICL